MPVWKRGKDGVVLPRDKPKYTARLVIDVEEKMKELKGKSVIDEDRADRDADGKQVHAPSIHPKK